VNATSPWCSAGRKKKVRKLGEKKTTGVMSRAVVMVRKKKKKKKKPIGVLSNPDLVE